MVVDAAMHAASGYILPNAKDGKTDRLILYFSVESTIFV